MEAPGCPKSSAVKLKPSYLVSSEHRKCEPVGSVLTLTCVRVLLLHRGAALSSGVRCRLQRVTLGVQLLQGLQARRMVSNNKRGYPNLSA